MWFNVLRQTQFRNVKGGGGVQANCYFICVIIYLPQSYTKIETLIDVAVDGLACAHLLKGDRLECSPGRGESALDVQNSD